MILLSQSLTAIVFLMALIFSYIIYNLLNPKLIIPIVVTVILVGVLIFAFTAGSNLWRSTLEVLDLFFQHKQESIDQHLLFQWRGPTDWLGSIWIKHSPPILKGCPFQ
jgi:hypothetical protein